MHTAWQERAELTTADTAGVRDLAFGSRLLGAPIHRLESVAITICAGQLEVVPGKTHRNLRLRAFSVGDESGLISPNEGLVSLVNRPGTKVSGEPARRLAKFRGWCVQAGIAASLELGAVCLALHEGMSPTGVEDKDASRIGAEILPLLAVRLCDLV